MKGFQICFFSIPLITIIALFVLNIFLPIVVFIFNLWFLLAFKFCILPSISLAGKLQAELDAVPPSVNVDTDASLSVDVDLDGTAEVGPKAVQEKLARQLGADIAADTGMDKNKVQEGLSLFANSPLIALNKSNAELQKLNQDPKSDPPMVDYTAGLEFEERRLPEVAA